jgi:hypothetical protein
MRADTGDVISFAAAREQASAGKALRAEAKAIEAASGKTLYSDFIAKHGRRPDPKEAAAIGRHIGAQVVASNGKKYPRRTRQELESARQRKSDHLRKLEEIWRLQTAVTLVAQNAESPSALIDKICESEAAAIGPNLRKAIAWLAGFEREWVSRGHQSTGKASDERA